MFPEARGQKETETRFIKHHSIIITIHQSNHTPEQRGVDVYLNGSIYTDYNETDKTPIGPNFTYNDKYMVIGPHSFKDGEDVTGRYELRYQWWGLGYWIPDEYYVGPREGERETRIVAIPLPSKGQEGEAERKALTIQDVIQAYTDGYSNGNIDTGLSGHEYVLNKYGTTPAP